MTWGRVGNTHFEMERDVDGREDWYMNTEGENVRNCNLMLENNERKESK